MDSYDAEWNDIIEGGLARDVPGDLDPALAARIEARIEDDRASRAVTAEDRGRSLFALFGLWLILAAGLVALHAQAAPAAYEALLASTRSLVEGTRLDLIAAAALALLATEVAARLVQRDSRAAAG